jgi:hypothetical protein
MPREKINIFQALAMAGDVGMYGDRSRIRILRETYSEADFIRDLEVLANIKGKFLLSNYP